MKRYRTWIAVGLLGWALGVGTAAWGARSIFDMDGAGSEPGYIPEQAQPRPKTGSSSSNPPTTQGAPTILTPNPPTTERRPPVVTTRPVVVTTTRPVSSTTQVATSQPVPAPVQRRAVAVPGEAELAAATKTVRDLYKAEFARATDLSGKRILSQKLGKQGAATSNDPAARYVLFVQARDLAVDAGEARLALDAMNALEWYFELKDSNNARIQTLSRLVPTATATPDSADVLISNALDLISDAVFTDDYPALNRLTATVTALKGKCKNDVLRARALTTLREVQIFSGEYPRVKIAQELLKTKPDDPVANLTLGRYLCWAKENWARGLTHLAKCSDADLKAAALRDLTNPTDPLKKVEVADCWSERADKDAANKPWLQRRALKWYKEALPATRGLAQVKIKQRIRAIEGFGLVNLIGLLDPTKDKNVLGGDWSITNGELAGRGWNSLHHVEFPYVPPEEYDLCVEFTLPETGEGNTPPTVSLLVSRDKSELAWCMGHRDYRDYHGFYYGFINPESFDPNKAGVFRRALRTLPAGRHTTMVRVRRDKIQTYLDDEMVIEFRTNGNNPVQIIRHPMTKGYGLGLEYHYGSSSSVVFHKAECIEITGEGHLLHGE